MGTSEIPSSWSPRCSPNSDHPCDFADVPRDVLVLPPASLRGGLAGSAYGSRDVCFPPATLTVKTFHMHLKHSVSVSCIFLSYILSSG